MAIDKIEITDRLRNHIIEIRKERGLSSYKLSEESGHSKFWLQNIESGKTKKINKTDLISIYKVLYETDDDSEASYYIEQILNQQVGSHDKNWYELINISDDFSEEYDKMELIRKLRSFISKDICDTLIQSVYNMSVNQAQAALSAVQNLSYSIYKNPELALALINIPVYGVSMSNRKEYQTALNDLLAINAKYNDLVIKHHSLDIIREWKERDKQLVIENKRIIRSALDNYKSMLNLISSLKNIQNPPIFDILNQFNTSVSFMIERACPGTLENFLDFRPYTGKEFVTLIDECFEWFYDNENTYDLPRMNKYIPSTLYNEACDFLNTIGEIKPLLQ